MTFALTGERVRVRCLRGGVAVEEEDSFFQMNETLLVAGYGSLQSGHGLLTVRRNGKSRLVALDAFPLAICNARRGLAKPTAHGRYLAMDLEPADVSAPIAARAGLEPSQGEIGALGLVFEHRWAKQLALREEYDPAKFLELIAIADQAGMPLGEFLLRIAAEVDHDLVAYRTALAKLLGYTSPGYIFHPLPLEDGRVAIVAIGSGFHGSGDPAVQSRRAAAGIDRLMSLEEALKFDRLEIEAAGQIGYFLECILGGAHGLFVGDLIAELNGTAESLAQLLAQVFNDEHRHFLDATALTAARYKRTFGTIAQGGIAHLLDMAGVSQGE
jgi:hypothetical protein